MMAERLSIIEELYTLKEIKVDIGVFVDEIDEFTRGHVQQSVDLLLENLVFIEGVEEFFMFRVDAFSHVSFDE
jgi:hypothetical protein